MMAHVGAVTMAVSQALILAHLDRKQQPARPQPICSDQTQLDHLKLQMLQRPRGLLVTTMPCLKQYYLSDPKCSNRRFHIPQVSHSACTRAMLGSTDVTVRMAQFL